MQVSSFTARGLKAAFVSAEDCDREVIHGGEYQLVLISPELTCIGERCCEHKCTSKILWPLLLMRQAHCVSKWLVGTYLLSILVENVQFKLVLSITVYALSYMF